MFGKHGLCKSFEQKHQFNPKKRDPTVCKYSKKKG